MNFDDISGCGGRAGGPPVHGAGRRCGPPSASIPLPPLKIIFIVDDDPAHARICERILKRAGYGVVTAPDGDQALKLLAQSPIDVLLLDVVMPGRDGFEVLLALRKSRSSVPTIAMSGSGGPELNDALLAQCRMLGATSVLGKPFSEHELLAAVAAALGEAPATPRPLSPRAIAKERARYSR